MQHEQESVELFRALNVEEVAERSQDRTMNWVCCWGRYYPDAF